MPSSSWRYSPERNFGGSGIRPREFLLSLVLLLSAGFFSKGRGWPGEKIHPYGGREHEARVTRVLKKAP
jgi:hypothetical protein